MGHKRRDFFKQLFGVAVVPLIPIEVPRLPRPKSMEQMLIEAMTAEIQREIDMEIIRDLQLLAKGTRPYTPPATPTFHFEIQHQPITVRTKRLKTKWKLVPVQELEHTYEIATC